MFDWLKRLFGIEPKKAKVSQAHIFKEKEKQLLDSIREWEEKESHIVNDSSQRDQNARRSPIPLSEAGKQHRKEKSEYNHRPYVGKDDGVDNGEDNFLPSLALGAVAGTIVGGLVGGDFVGAALGDAMTNDDDIQKSNLVADNMSEFGASDSTDSSYDDSNDDSSYDSDDSCGDWGD